MNLFQYRANVTVSKYDFFNPVESYGSCFGRINGFDKAYYLMTSEQKKIIHRTEQRLMRFGYSLAEGRHYPYRCQSTVFSDWDIATVTPQF